MWGGKAKLHATVQFIPKKTPTEKQTQSVRKKTGAVAACSHTAASEIYEKYLDYWHNKMIN